MAEHRQIAENRKAFHDYHVIERLEAGIVLLGTEIKSLRMGQVNLREGYARIDHGELWLHNVHISPYTHGNINNHEPLRTRKLLVNRRELIRLLGKTREKGLTLVPLKMYWVGDWAKVEIGLVRGKKEYDKRAAISEREGKRDIERTIKRAR